MGLLGDILYPNNKEMAADLNKKYQQLLDNNTLQNNLVNSYHGLASPIKTFDGYLMALICMQYQIVYDEEKLANLPETDIPKLSQSIADRIEAYTFTAVGVAQGLQGLNAMRKGVVNIYRNAGTYKQTISEGFDSFKSAMQNGLDRVRFKVNSMRSGNISSLTEENLAKWNELNPELTAEGKIELLDQEEVEKLNSEEGENWEAVDEEVMEEADTVSTGAEIGEEAAAEAAEGTASLSEAFSAILGPAMMIIIVVTEIISAVEAGEMNEKLKKAETEIDNHLAAQQKALESLKKAFKNLLNCAMHDIDEYNEMIKDIISLSASKKNFFVEYRGYTPGEGFGYKGIDGYQKALDSIKDGTDITMLQGFAESDLKDVQTCITAQATQDSKDTEIIITIKAWLVKHNLTDITDAYIEELVDVFSLTPERVKYCNSLRKYLNEIAAKLAPYHKAIQGTPQKPGTQTQQPEQDPINHQAPPEPSYSPDPNDFTLPPP